MPCTYCNFPSDTRDHVVPKSWSGNLSFAERYVVPCCKDCNTLLGAAPVHTVEERAAWLYEKYLKRFKKELNSPDWSDAELKQMSSSMKKYIKAKQTEKKIISNKLKNLRQLGQAWLNDTEIE